MKRLILEFGLAVCIFTAANAVYGIDALISQSFELDIIELLGTTQANPGNFREDQSRQAPEQACGGEQKIQLSINTAPVECPGESEGL